MRAHSIPGKPPHICPSPFNPTPRRNSLSSTAQPRAGTGDVKYHLGTSFDRPTLGGKRIHLSLMANPSHLEAVNTVVQGKVRAKQYYTEDKERSRIMPILLHGDGAFAGQGVVTEALDMNQLPDYTVRIHTRTGSGLSGRGYTRRIGRTFTCAAAQPRSANSQPKASEESH